MATLPLTADDKPQPLPEHTARLTTPTSSIDLSRANARGHVPIGCHGEGSSHPVLTRDALDRAAHAGVAALTGGLSPTSVALAFMDWALHMAVAPGRLLELSSEAVLASAEVVHGTMRTNVAPPKHGHAPEDPRFADDAWAAWPFHVYREGFLRIQHWWETATTAIPGVERHHEELVRFLARQWLDACAPSNFIATNPVVQRAAWSSGGTSFVTGTLHWLADLRDLVQGRSGDQHAHPSEWLPGKHVAITPGKVVWRSELCELLQYAPTTPTVAKEPILIVPSWIMKYYILDLQPHDSLIRYLVDGGYTVYAISWRNPGEAFRDVGLEAYLREGLLAALAQVRERDAQRVHLVGYCLGGTLLAIAAAALFRDGRGDELKTVTLLAAQTDFTEPGELGLFIDASELAALDALMWRQGYLDGSQMSAAFQLLKARDLVWSRMMSEYLLGRRSQPNDLMAWNADTTRLPYRMHSEYLTSLFLNNDLAEGRYCVGGRPVALSDIEAPMFVVGTERDHVSPWRSVYKLHLLTHNDLTFLLTAGGHNAGIVSQPGHPDRYYRCATRAAGEPYRGRQEFLSATEPVDGSWWPRWNAWLRDHSDGEVVGRAIVDGLDDAPGTYVFER
ncbi:alpha/beta fold hydrolase [Paraburkholderia sp. Tr-20389]|uniref:PHA/PHB synthase family protein n=1 Tax=Paraburkholderia sp. Tr-20389 TaxID=2703903 RepID=UPI00197DDD0A|nr:alpha/beta fold hydrolase [Paraburkholderia sp. Tr-20389]MBN3752234.1 alpha/beta fold hydrolase [Paraburkholderia sp. Tr-20389]